MLNNDPDKWLIDLIKLGLRLRLRLVNLGDVML